MPVHPSQQSLTSQFVTIVRIDFRARDVDDRCMELARASVVYGAMDIEAAAVF